MLCSEHDKEWLTNVRLMMSGGIFHIVMYDCGWLWLETPLIARAALIESCLLAFSRSSSLGLMSGMNIHGPGGPADRIAAAVW